MKVSVVITTYNRASYIRQAIDSVLCQTLDDYELIVVDDGSTDGTEAVLAPYRDRIRYQRIAHGGPAAARNAGMEIARGDYVCFLDSDDRCHAAKLALQAAVLDAFPDVAWVSSEISAFDDRGRWEEFHLRDYHKPAFRRGRITYESLFEDGIPIAAIPGVGGVAGLDPSWAARRLHMGSIFDIYLIELVVFAVSIMFRRLLLQETGMQNTRLEFFEEREFALRLCRGRRVAFLDVPLYQHRYHPGQMSTKAGPRSQWIQIRKQQDLLHVLRIHGLRDHAYYAANGQVIDRQFARLCRAVAIPLLAFDRGSPHQHQYFPRRARAYLRQAATHGHANRLLMISSFLPFWPRRILIKFESILRRVQIRLTA